MTCQKIYKNVTEITKKLLPRFRGDIRQVFIGRIIAPRVQPTRTIYVLHLASSFTCFVRCLLVYKSYAVDVLRVLTVDFAVDTVDV